MTRMTAVRARRPRVAHVTPQHFGDSGVVGGGERYPTELAKAMAELTPTRLIGFGDVADVVTDRGLEVVTLPTWPWLSRSPQSPIPRSLRTILKDIDVLHLHQWETETSNLLTLAGALSGREVYATDHGGWSPNHWRRLRLHKFLAGFLPVSEFSASFYPELAGRTQVIHGGANISHRSPLPLSERSDEVLFVGRLLPHKGIDVLLSALDVEIPVRIVGRPYDQHYLSRLQGLACGRPVTIEENASDERICDLYDRARIVVLPSRYRPTTGPAARKPELLGLTLIEAMSRGTPVVCCRTGGMPEVVRPGNTGFVVEEDDHKGLRDAIYRLMTDDVMWAQFSVAARKDVESRFTWSATARRCLTSYETLGRRRR